MRDYNAILELAKEEAERIGLEKGRAEGRAEVEISPVWWYLIFSPRNRAIGGEVHHSALMSLE